VKWILIAACVLPVAALAQERHERRYDEWPEGRILLAPKFGIALPVANLPGSLAAGLELGYRTPWLSRRLIVVAQASWTRPSFDGADYSAVAHHFGAIAALAYRLDGLPSVLAPYGGIGAGLFRTQATVEFPQEGIARHETDTRPGIVAFAGIDMLSGVGALFLELRAVHAPTRIPSLRDSSVEPLSIVLGYRLFLPP